MGHTPARPYPGAFCMQNGVFCISYRSGIIYIRHMYNAKAYSAASSTSRLASAPITRRDPAEQDLQIEILFCGVCHSDLHSVRNQWSEFMPTVYPIVDMASLKSE